MRFFYSILFLFFFIPVCNSQDVNVDSLHLILKDRITDTTRIKTNNEIGLSYQYSFIDSAIFYHKKALKLSEKIKDDYFVIISIRELCWSYFQKGEYGEGIEKSNLGIKLIQKSKNKRVIKLKDILLGTFYGNLGNIYANQGKYNESLKFYFKSYSYYQNTNNKMDQATVLGNIGTVYNDMQENEKALDYQMQALKLSEEIKDDDGIATRLSSIGGVYGSMGENEKALNNYQRSFEIFEKLNNEYAMAIIINNIGYINILQKNYKDALSNLKLSEELSVKTGDKSNLALTYINIGVVYTEKGEFENAIMYYKKGEAIATEINALDLLTIVYDDFYQVYELKRDFKSTFYYHKKYIEYRDSLADKDNAEQKIQQEIQFEYDKKAFADSLNYSNQKRIKDAEISKQRAIAQQKDLEVQSKKKQQYYLFAGLGMVLLFSLLLFNRYRFVQRQKKIIEEKEKETSLQKKIIEEKHKEISDSINYAERIQKSFLASSELLDENLKNYFVLFKPKEAVSGDFYWASQLTNGNFVLACADSTGHGVPGAIMSILNITSLEKSIETKNEPADILNETRKIIIDRLKNDGSVEGGKDGMDCSLLCFDFENNILEFALANNPLWLIRNNELIDYKPDKMPVGKHDKQNIPFTNHKIELQKDDTIYIFTDGFADQFGGPKGKKFKYSNLQKLLLENINESPSLQKQKLEVAFKFWIGDLEQVDDVCVIGIRI